MNASRVIPRVVAAPHRSQYPNPISFAPGDPLVLGARDDEFPGWIRASTADGNEGWAPESLIEVTGPGRGVAAEPYSARELNTRIGDVLLVLLTLNGWAWVRDTGGDEGWVPERTLAD